MTKEEAIKLLKYNSNVIHKTINGDTDPNEADALDMAIKALEQTSPCDLCRYNPPSSGDGKPCSMCPASNGGDEE